jgi:hypothetical protein
MPRERIGREKKEERKESRGNCSKQFFLIIE